MTSNEPKRFPRAAIETSLPTRFEAQVLEFPDNLAVGNGEKSLTYDELNRQSNRLAHKLHSLGIQNSPVAFLLEHGEAPVIAVLGILKSHNIYVPLDAAFPVARLEFMLQDTEAGVIVTNSVNMALAEQLSQVGEGGRQLINLDALESTLSDENLDLPIQPDDLANILYTSGSTGKPKGVTQNHRNILQSMWSSVKDYDVTHSDRFGLLFSCGFAASTTPMLCPLLMGASTHPINLKERLSSLGTWLKEEKISVYMSVTTVFRHFASQLDGRGEFPSLRLVILGGEPVLRADVALYQAHFTGETQFSVRLAGTEMHRIRSYVVPWGEKLDGGIVPVGYGVDDKEIRLLDENGAPVAQGEVGEISITSAYLTPGYWKQEALTEEVFSRDAADPGMRTYCSGDLGRFREDGCLEHMGRKDSLVKIRGHRVELGEIESALLDLEAVDQAVVVPHTDDKGNVALIAYLVEGAGATPTSEFVRRALGDRLPDYMVPSMTMVLEAMPMTATGKVDRKSLPEPERKRPDLSESYVAPTNGAEKRVVRNWEEALEISPIGIHDNFFTLGGNSVIGTSIIDRIHKDFSVNLPMSALTDNPTVSELVKVIRQYRKKAPESEDRWVCLRELNEEGDKPPLFCVPGGGCDVTTLKKLSELLGDDQPFYGFQHVGMDGVTKPYNRIEPMASQFLEEMIQLQPQGPYYLAGSSFGGVIAFEIAQQLKARGEEVALLVLMDTAAPGYPIPTKRFHPLPLFYLLIGMGWVPEDWKQKRTLVRMRRVFKRHKHRTKQRLLKWYYENSDTPKPYYYRSVQLLDLAKEAKANYSPDPYDTSVLIIRTQHKPCSDYYRPDSTLGWGSWLKGPVSYIDIDGPHGAQIKEPWVKDCAARLRKQLDKVFAEKPGK